MAGLVIDRHVVSVCLREIARLLRPARDADGAAAAELRQLADDLPDCTGRTRDYDCVAGPRLPDVVEAEVGRESGRADDVQRERRRLQPRRNPPQRPGACDCVLLPTELPDDQLSGLEPRLDALDDLADAVA